MTNSPIKNVLIAIGTLAFMASISAVQGAGTKVTISECEAAGGVLSDDVATGDVFCCFQNGSECYRCSDCIPEDVIIFKKKGQSDVQAPRSNLKRPPKRNLKQQSRPK